MSTSRRSLSRSPRGSSEWQPFAADPWPASAAVGEIPGVVVTALVAIWYLGSVVVALRPRDWRAEDELHNRSIGEYR